MHTKANTRGYQFFITSSPTLSSLFSFFWQNKQDGPGVNGIGYGIVVNTTNALDTLGILAFLN